MYVILIDSWWIGYEQCNNTVFLSVSVLLVMGKMFGVKTLFKIKRNFYQIIVYLLITVTRQIYLVEDNVPVRVAHNIAELLT